MTTLNARRTCPQFSCLKQCHLWDFRVTKWLPYVLRVAPFTYGDWTGEEIYVKTPCGTRNCGFSPRHGS